MRRVALSIALAAMVSAASASTINSSYDVRGDGAARPVQVFDDGKTIYVQLRDLRQVPVPIGPKGPLPYQLRGYYMTLPLGAAPFTLQLGASRVQVSATGVADGVVSLTKPVEALDPPPPPMAPAPVVALAEESREVTGTIVVGGRATRPETGSARTTERVPVAGDEEVFASAIRAIDAGDIAIRGDGTVAGAEAMKRARGVCQKLKRTCRVEYRGAEQGFLHVEGVR